jgi:drug/metabolite transporter (DMT)-like permease
MKEKKGTAVFFAFLAAVFYALNLPLSKVLLEESGATMMAAFLYLGAGVGIGLLYFSTGQQKADNLLTREDLPYTIGMIVLDIAAPILLMLGLTTAAASDASLLNNFEIVATALIALFLFREKISGRLWAGIFLITVSSILLSVEGQLGFSFSKGSLLVLLATCCWGLENNCTRQISEKNTYQIVMVKGIFSGTGSFLVALCCRESIPQAGTIGKIMLLGFVAYGLSIFYYVRAQKVLGAAKTSAYYAVAPFVGAALSFFLLKEPLSRHYFLALVIMMAGSILVVADTMILNHRHLHTHVITHTHDGSTHTHEIVHEHGHFHLVDQEEGHHHWHGHNLQHSRQMRL